MINSLRIFLALMLLGTLGARANGAPIATRLNEDNIEDLQPAGPDAIAGLGDWVLSNGTLCAAISAIEHETGFSPWAGGLLDRGARQLQEVE